MVVDDGDVTAEYHVLSAVSVFWVHITWFYVVTFSGEWNRPVLSLWCWDLGLYFQNFLRWS